jgi:hypothetical protein
MKYWMIGAEDVVYSNLCHWASFERVEDANVMEESVCEVLPARP